MLMSQTLPQMNKEFWENQSLPSGFGRIWWFGSYFGDFGGFAGFGDFAGSVHFSARC